MKLFLFFVGVYFGCATGTRNVLDLWYLLHQPITFGNLARVAYASHGNEFNHKLFDQIDTMIKPSLRGGSFGTIDLCIDISNWTATVGHTHHFLMNDIKCNSSIPDEIRSFIEMVYNRYVDDWVANDWVKKTWIFGDAGGVLTIVSILSRNYLMDELDDLVCVDLAIVSSSTPFAIGFNVSLSREHVSVDDEPFHEIRREYRHVPMNFTTNDTDTLADIADILVTQMLLLSDDWVIHSDDHSSETHASFGSPSLSADPVQILEMREPIDPTKPILYLADDGVSILPLGALPLGMDDTPSVVRYANESDCRKFKDLDWSEKSLIDESECGRDDLECGRDLECPPVHDPCVDVQTYLHNISVGAARKCADFYHGQSRRSENYYHVWYSPGYYDTYETCNAIRLHDIDRETNPSRHGDFSQGDTLGWGPYPGAVGRIELWSDLIEMHADMILVNGHVLTTEAQDLVINLVHVIDELRARLDKIEQQIKNSRFIPILFYFRRMTGFTTPTQTMQQWDYWITLFGIVCLLLVTIQRAIYDVVENRTTCRALCRRLVVTLVLTFLIHLCFG